MKLIRIDKEEQLQEAFNIRKEVFVKEQGVPIEDEFDQYDSLQGNCIHILAYIENKPVGTARIRVVDGLGKLERICILPFYRKHGLGKEIVSYLEKVAIEMGINEFKLHGQTQVQHFYEKLGYVKSSEVFIEDGIPHILMKKSI